MADCPGVLHLAAMADGGLARIRTLGGALTGAQARAVGEAAERLGSGVVDLTNRANLQIRGLAPDAGPELASRLEAAGFRFGRAERRRNILLDPFSGIDPGERRDLRSLGAALDQALSSAPWIESLSPKFSFVLDGGGPIGIGATPSDVAVVAARDGLVVTAGQVSAAFGSEDGAVDALLSIAAAAAAEGGDMRAGGLSEPMIRKALTSSGGAVLATPPPRANAVEPRLGLVAMRAGGVALSLPVPVGRLDQAMLDFLANIAERDGEGRLVLTPWSAVVIPGLAESRAAALLAPSVAVGFPPLAVAERLAVVACAGAPACERAHEPAKALGREILALAASDPARLPERRASLHLSGCPKGCGGAVPADLLLLGSSERAGWSAHRDAAPRRPGQELGRLEAPGAAEALALLATTR
ncbi:precorrin-3B synthase [Hansschlegelia zhihuaiae]|uniref:Precorrin-3B synthase n=1 Tax=Hansschlegelia zhihuaiae TaxID=405005 RepID=A0A4V1KJF3_9HYPH|nr:precorrin-3B synthase [Hansschlegelia zhihuaiae]RXF73992.1 precorrin-3B synthase [Hansschlegelia zhihuaiae]